MSSQCYYTSPESQSPTTHTANKLHTTHVGVRKSCPMRSLTGIGSCSAVPGQVRKDQVGSEMNECNLIAMLDGFMSNIMKQSPLGLLQHSKERVRPG